MICKRCAKDYRTKIAGQAFTDYSCPICGKVYTHHNTGVPKVCDKCSEKYHVRQECGHAVIDNA